LSRMIWNKFGHTIPEVISKQFRNKIAIKTWPDAKHFESRTFRTAT